MNGAISWLEWHEEPVLGRIISRARALGVNDASSWLESGLRLKGCKYKVIINFVDAVVHFCINRTA